VNLYQLFQASLAPVNTPDTPSIQVQLHRKVTFTVFSILTPIEAYEPIVERIELLNSELLF
jgi:hypothetical protein